MSTDPRLCPSCGSDVCGIELFDDVAGRLDQLDEYRRCRKCGARWVARYQVLSVMLLDPQP